MFSLIKYAKETIDVFTWSLGSGTKGDMIEHDIIQDVYRPQN